MYMKPETTNYKMQLLKYSWGDETWALASDGPWDESIEILKETSGDLDKSQKWFARLTREGTLDVTDWTGPYNSEGAAVYALWDEYDNAETSFYDFLGEGKFIVESTLEMRGLRNELYGQPTENFDREGMIWLATLGDIDLDENGEQIKGYNPNHDAGDLAEAYGFALVDHKRALELRMRFAVYRNAYMGDN